MISARDFLRGKTAAVFDFDGTLADTLGIWNAVDVQLAAELGHPNADPEAWHAFREESLRRHRDEENPFRSYCGDFGAKLGSSLTAAEIHQRRFTISRRLLKNDVQLQPNAAEALKSLKALGLRLAVATTTRRANIEIYCNTNEGIRREIHLADVFEGLICAEDVERIKPDPECYVKALALLGVTPERAFAVEDTVAGLEAARAAGLKCLAMREPHSAEDAERIRSLSEVYFDDYAAFLKWFGASPL